MVTYAKLRDGSWGLRGPASELVPGSSVTVRKANGAEKTETVRALLAGPFPDGNALASMVQSARAARSSGVHTRRRGGRLECEECGEYVQPGSRCWETGMAH